MTLPLPRRAPRACVTLSLTLAAAVATAGTATEAPADAFDEVVVTATRVAQPVERALEPVIVIDRSTIEDAYAVDVGDLLRFHAGLDIARTGGPGQPLTLFIRGANSNQSIVMIDGVRINAGTLSLAPLQNLSPELFERIEVVEGPRSAIYGTDAIGGVVNMITRNGGPDGAAVMLDYGRYATGEFAVDGNYTAGATSMQAALNGIRTDAFPTFAGDTQNSPYKNLSGTAAVTTRVGDLELGARYWQSSGDTHYSNGVYNADYTAFQSYTPASETYANSLIAVHAAGDITDSWRALATLSRIRDDLRQEQVPDYDYTSRDTLDLQNDVRLSANGVNQIVTFGAILTSEQTNSLSYGTGYSVDTHTQTYYLQDQFEAGANRLLVAGGYYHHPAFGDHLTWNGEYGYALTPSLLLTAGAGTAFRAPSASDRFGYGGNPDLLPESSRNFDLGLKARLGEHEILSVDAFQNTIDDLIVGVPDPQNVVYGYQNENIDRARIRGVQAALDLHYERWSMRAEGSVQDPRDLGSDTDLLRRARHSATLGATRRLGRVELGADLLYSGPRADLTAAEGAPVTDGGYLLVSLRGKIELSSAWSVTARLDNALDRDYQLANGYNTAGRAASIATRYSFR